MNQASAKKANLLAIGIGLFALSAMLGDVLKVPVLKGVELASCAAPYTKVFGQAVTYEDKKPFETFAAEFHLYYTTENEEMHIVITPEVYQKLAGPYQRRNVYGAILAYGPALSEDIQKRTFDYAVNTPGTIRKELGIPADATDIRVEMISSTKGNSSKWVLQGK